MAATPVLMLSGADLTQSDRSLIGAYWTDITAFLAPPGIVWRWSESGLPNRVKQRFRESGLIRRAPGGKRWETTGRLWRYVIKRAGDDESIGSKAKGQQLLLGTYPSK